MYPDWDDPLLTLFTTYQAAVVRSSGLQERLRHAAGDADLLDRSLFAAEQVIESRAAFYRGLMNLGWTPPARIVADLNHDSELLPLRGT
ncbi:MAG: hypothetical protein ABIO67_08030 [Mycobacteriales bacterium]